MKVFLKVFAVVAVMGLLGPSVFAVTEEAPPMEPPYTNDSEFDAILGEDPAASNNPIPVSPAQSEPFAPDDFEKSPPKKVSSAPPEAESKEAPSGVAGRKPLQKGVKLIRHPDAKKGLLRIEQDGAYIYKVKTQPKDETGILRYGLMEPPKIVSADGRTDFATMYTSDPLGTLMFDYEWQPFSKYGKLGVQAGFALTSANGKGRFLKDGAVAPENYTFIILPLNLGVIYRLEYFRRQWVAPYVAGGGSYIAVVEMRDDDKNNFSGTPAAYGAGGLMFNITALDKSLAFNLDSEYGVGNLWLVAEYRYQKAFSEDLDFSGALMSFGISADF